MREDDDQTYFYELYGSARACLGLSFLKVRFGFLKGSTGTVLRLASAADESSEDCEAARACKARQMMAGKKISKKHISIVAHTYVRTGGESAWSAMQDVAYINTVNLVCYGRLRQLFFRVFSFKDYT